MIFHQSVFDKWPLEDKSVQAIITSPPFWGLRFFPIPDITLGEWTGQYGAEPTMQAYIEHTLLWAKEAWRVLRDDGIFFLNLGDSYAGSNGNGTKQTKCRINATSGGVENFSLNKVMGKKDDYQSKCKLLIPHRIAIALIDEGWILRNDLIWHKGNAMPESCGDRFSKKFEYIFMFVKQTKYYFDLDAVRERHKGKTDYDYNKAKLDVTHGKGDIRKGDFANKKFKQVHQQGLRSGGNLSAAYKYIPGNLNGKNPGDVWQINTQPSSEAHFAMWPEKLVERMVLCSTKKGDIVLDPFVGSGTTLKVAEELGRKGLGIDLGHEDIQARRLNKIQKKLW